MLRFQTLKGLMGRIAPAARLGCVGALAVFMASKDRVGGTNATRAALVCEGLGYVDCRSILQASRLDSACVSTRNMATHA